MKRLVKTLPTLLFFVLAVLSSAAYAETKATPAVICPENSAPCERGIPGNAMVSERLFGLPGLTNAGRVAPGIYRGAQPTKEGYVTLKKMGIKTVVNLRSGHSERKDVAAAGMASVEVPFTTLSVNPKRVERVLAILKDKSNHPVFFHCMEGKDRTGVIAAVYRMEVGGWSYEDADAEMLSYGFHQVWTKLREFVEEYGKRGASGGRGVVREAEAAAAAP